MNPTLRESLIGAYSRHVPGFVRTAVRRARNDKQRAERQRDLVSVVIPVYNVEDYLAECLDSVLAQSYRNLDVIVVDDGSPDNSYEIARAYRRRDRRIRIIRQANRGLGGARNTGIEHARGKYLFFMDSDDTLPRNAIEVLVNSLSESGSDFAIGAPVRLERGKTWLAGWVKDVHAVDRYGLTLEEFPEILKDVFATNKLFDTAFFRRVVGGFPERIRYEDQEPTAKAYVAGRFDVLTAPVYYWRVRDDGTSITQQKSNPDDLRDRLTVKNKVSAVISAGASVETHNVWLAKAIGFDLRGYFEQVPRTDRDFFDRLQAGMNALATRMTPDIWELVSMIDRIPALAVLDGKPDDVTAAVTRRDEYGWFFPTEVRDDGVYLAGSYLDGLSLQPTKELLRVGAPDLRIVSKATSLWWRGSTLMLEGHAYITNVPFDEASTITVDLVSADGVRVPVPVTQRRDVMLAVETSDAWNDHSESGFAVEIDPTVLPIGANDPWRVEITVNCPGVSRTGVLRDRDTRGIAGSRPVARALGKVRWMATFEEENCLTLRHTGDLEAPVTAIESDDHGIVLTVLDPQATSVRLTSRSLNRTVEVAGAQHDGGTVTFPISLPDLLPGDNLAAEHSWSVRAHGGGVEPRRLTYYGSAAELAQEAPEHARVRIAMTRAGTIRILQNRWWAVADDIQIGAETLTVSGRINAPGATGLEARMVNESQVLHADRFEVDSDGRFEIRIPFNAGGTVPTTRLGFSVRLAVWLDGVRQERWLAVSEALQHRFPYEASAARYGVTITRTKKAGALWVRFRLPLGREERGRFNQRRLHQHFRRPTATGGGLEPEPRESVLFESYNGKGIGDSVLAIFNEFVARDLNLELFWTVADLSMDVPPGARPLLIHSEEWMDVLHNSRYLVNNNNFPFYFRKRDGQVYVQTWHGTPLKRIGEHVPGANLSLPYRQLMKREAKYWDLLLAQNDFAADILPQAFGYAGPVLNEGYPRNDVLVGPEAQLRRKQARAALGLRDEETAVLYAPTWRDNVSAAAGYARVSFLDFEAARSAIPGPSTILMRGHSNTLHDRFGAPDGVLDVTGHPDVNDLILASDLLITDYSSLMFDYCVTGKPILFLTPDLDEYRDVTRGFYLDLAEIAPGPLCMDNDALAETLRTLDETQQSFADRYGEFTRKFAPRDDGLAARRVVDRILSV